MWLSTPFLAALLVALVLAATMGRAALDFVVFAVLVCLPVGVAGAVVAVVLAMRPHPGPGWSRVTGTLGVASMLLGGAFWLTAFLFERNYHFDDGLGPLLMFVFSALGLLGLGLALLAAAGIGRLLGPKNQTL